VNQSIKLTLMGVQGRSTLSGKQVYQLSRLKHRGQGNQASLAGRKFFFKAGLGHTHS
jgi:hypothetical protein